MHLAYSTWLAHIPVPFEEVVEHPEVGCLLGLHFELVCGASSVVGGGEDVGGGESTELVGDLEALMQLGAKKRGSAVRCPVG